MTDGRAGSAFWVSTRHADQCPSNPVGNSLNMGQPIAAPPHFKKANEFLRLAEAIIESDPEAHKDRSGAHNEASISDSGLFNLPGNAPAA